MSEYWATEELPGIAWDDLARQANPPDDIPTPWDVRQAELNDLRNQGNNLIGIYRATTIHAPEYL